MIRKLSFIFCFFLFVLKANGQIQNAQVDSIFSDWNKPGVPGGVVGIIKDGELIFSKGYGMANLDYNIPNSPQTSFHVGSTSKQFTAACIILMVEQGQLNLESTLYEFFPEFPDYSKKITVRHLLNHTSGIRDYFYLFLHKAQGVDYPYTDDDIMEMLVRQKNINFEPGENVFYSNSGYWLLGQIVEKVSGKRLSEYAQSEIFEPLQMKNTQFNDEYTSVVKNRASPYFLSDDGNYKIYNHSQNAAGATGIMTTIDDMKKWDDAFYSSDILSENFWSMMKKPGTLKDGSPTVYNLEKDIVFASGLMIGKYKGLNTVSHPGAIASYRSQMIRFPDQRFTVIVFSNSYEGNAFDKANKVVDLFLKEFFTESPKAVFQDKPIINMSSEDLQKFEGDYWTGEHSQWRKIYLKNDTLWWTGNIKDWAIVPIGENEFRFATDSDRVIFSTNANGQFIYTMLPGIENAFPAVTSIRYKKVILTHKEQQEYVGIYYSDELDLKYEFKILDGTLEVFANSRLTGKAETMTADWFFEGGRNLRFVRNKKGIIIGLNLRDASGLSDIYFVKM